MQPIPPYPTIPGDNVAPILGADGAERIRPNVMARSGQLLGFTRSRFVWRFGFTKGSDSANAFGVCSDGWPGFLFILCNARGRELARFTGAACELPKRFRAVINGAIR